MRLPRWLGGRKNRTGGAAPTALRSSEPEAAEGSEAGTAESTPRSEAHQSLALDLLVQHLGSVDRPALLDLGRACGDNVTFFSRFSASIQIADFYRSLLAEGPLARQDPRRFAAACARLLPYPGDARFDLVLAWDLFNYLSLAEIAALGRHLTRFCRPGTLIFCLLSIQREIAHHPQAFQVLDPQTLLYRGSSVGLMPCPRYREPDLARALAGFQVAKVFLLRNGMQEYVLVHHPGSGGASAGGLSGRPSPSFR